MRPLLIVVRGMVHTTFSWVLVALHGLAVLLVYLYKPAQQGFGYHFYEEPSYYQALLLLDSPSILVAGVIF